MKLFSIFCLLCLLATAGWVESAVPTYSINLSIMDDSGRRTLGTGGFTAEDGDCGLVHLTFYDGGNDFVVSARGTKQSLGSYLHRGDAVFTRNLTSLVDVFLQPTAIGPGEIRVSGLIRIFQNQKASGEPQFSIVENQHNFTLSGEEEKAITIPAGKNGAPINAKISVTVLGNEELKPVPKPDIPQVTLKTSYSLHNKDRGKYEIEDCKCELGFRSGGGGVGSCSWEMVYYLDNGDSLLYLPSIQIKDVYVDEDKIITFSFEFTRIYAVNPDVISSYPDDIQSDKMTMVAFQKAISTRAGQETIVNITPDKDGLLPFKAEEKVTIICELQ